MAPRRAGAQASGGATRRGRGRSHRQPPGTAPGTLTAHPGAHASRIEVISYGPGPGPDGLARCEVASVAEIPPLPDGHRVRWVNVDGLRDAEVIRALGERYGLHPLALEDAVNVHQRPKVEAYADHLFVVARMPVLGTDARGPDRLATEQLSLCLGRDFVVTFQERPGDVFEPVRQRLVGSSGRIRARGADYLAYALLDAAIDSFFPLIEAYGETVEDLEQDVVARPETGHIARIHDLKRDLLTVRRAVWPQREMLNALIRDESPFVEAETRVFLRDCYDHSIQLIDMIETYREIASGLVDIQLSSASNRMNEVIKVLTVIATVFIPLTFIAGVYGMNFDRDAGPWNMPELGWRYGYPASLALMAAVAAALLLWFRRKGWLGGRRPPGRR